VEATSQKFVLIQRNISDFNFYYYCYYYYYYYIYLFIAFDASSPEGYEDIILVLFGRLQTFSRLCQQYQQELK